MKHFFLSILILTLTASEGTAQWKDFKFDNPAAFGVHDSSLFASKQGGDVYRYDTTAPYKWVFADTGMPLQSNFYVTAFGSIGSYVLAAVNAAFGGDAYRSSNNGSSWILTKDPQSNCFLTWGKCIYSGGAGGVDSSSDSGMHWTHFSNSPPAVKALAVSGTVLIAGTNSGVFRSTDSGKSWTPTSVTAPTTSLVAIGPVIIAGLAGIYRSTDGGLQWLYIDTGVFKGGGGVTSLVTDGKNIFAGTNGYGVGISTDSGATWDTTNMNTGIPSKIVAIGAVFDTFLVASAEKPVNDVWGSYIRPISEMVPPKSAVNQISQAAPLTISAFPNPLSNSVTIAYNLPESSPVSMEIYDDLGHQVASLLTNLTETAGSHQMEFHADKLPSGIYLCKFTANSSTQFITLSIEK